MPSDNEWHLLTLTVDYISSTDYTATIYLDGNVIVTDAQMTGAKGLVAGGTNFYIGAMRGDGVCSFNGFIDDFRIYDRALNETEIVYLATPKELIGHWKFDEVRGYTAWDASGLGNHGTVKGSGVFTANGKINGAVNFDAAGDVIDIIAPKGELANLGDGPFTISCWFCGGSAGGYIFSNNGVGSTSILLCRYNGDASSIDGYIGGRRYYRNGVLPTDNKWHLLTIAVNYVSSSNYNATIYLDGTVIVSDAEMTGTKDLASGAPGICIGALNAEGALPFYGRLDDVRIYNRRLAQTEIEEMAADSDLIGHYKLDEANDFLANDSSRSNTPGRLFADAAFVSDGKLNNCVTMDGGGVISIEKSGELLDIGNKSFTVSLWFKNGANYQSFFRTI